MLLKCRREEEWYGRSGREEEARNILKKVYRIQCCRFYTLRLWVLFEPLFKFRTPWDEVSFNEKILLICPPFLMIFFRVYSMSRNLSSISHPVTLFQRQSLSLSCDFVVKHKWEGTFKSVIKTLSLSVFIWGLACETLRKFDKLEVKAVF